MLSYIGYVFWLVLVSWCEVVRLVFGRGTKFHLILIPNHDIYTVNGITIRTLRLDFARNYNVLSFRHKVSQQYLVVCWLWRLGPCLNSTLWVRSSPRAFSNFFVGGSKVDPKLHPIHKGTCGDTIHSINTMHPLNWSTKVKWMRVVQDMLKFVTLLHKSVLRP